jgi:hypothetical protein
LPRGLAKTEVKMEDRIDSFLKVARTKLIDEYADRYVKNQLNELKGMLAELTADHEEKERLLNGYADIIRDAELAAWDEKFLGVIAGEKSPEAHLDEFTRQVSQGRNTGRTLTAPNQYLGAGAGTVPSINEVLKAWESE